MIDLDTGLPIDAQGDGEAETEIEGECGGDHDLETSALEEEEIEAALDEAFENFKLNQQNSSEELKETKES